MGTPEPLSDSPRLYDLPRLPRDDGGPVFEEPWQAQAFALAVKLSEQGHFTWKEWAAALADELKAAAGRGEPDDGSHYYEHWLAALERLVTAKRLTDEQALLARKEAWADAYRSTPHGTPIELPSSRTPDARWICAGLACTLAGYWVIHQSDVASVAKLPAGFAASALLGSLLGMQHAFEPDHLAAVATLMTDERSSRRVAWLGALWGLGHTLTLLVAGTALVVLRADMPGFVAAGFEWCVVVLLVGFGGRAIYRAACNITPRPTHTHGSPATARIDRWMIARPLLVGAVHGLAGSGTLTALVVATLPSTATRLGYLALFGLGSTLGMVALSGLLGWHVARMGFERRVVRAFLLAVGCASTVLGLFWGYPLLSRLL